MNRDGCATLDREDPLAAFRQRFALPPELVYLDGNSLGALPHATAAAVRRTVAEEWGQGLIGSWNNGWMEAPVRTGEKIARLAGAAPGQCVAGESTTVNLFRLLAAALAMRPGRHVILAESGDFPTDRYVAAGLTQLVPEASLRLVEPGTLTGGVDGDVAVVMVSHTHFLTARLQPVEAVTAAAHDAGALVLWDLSHSIGAVPVHLDAWDADLATGCGYKYLNGGPGAPAFVYVARRHHDALRLPINGWLGHAEPFAFEPSFRPAPGVGTAVAGTPTILGLAALEAAVDVMLEAGIEALREKSVRLTELFVALCDERLAGLGVEVASPRDPDERGSHVSLRHPDGYGVIRALVERGVVGDFRPPDVVRFGFAPLYNRFTEVWDAAAAMHEVLGDGAHRDARFAVRAPVT